METNAVAGFVMSDSSAFHCQISCLLKHSKSTMFEGATQSLLWRCWESGESVTGVLLQSR